MIPQNDRHIAFCMTPADDTAVEEAKAYIKAQSLTQEDCRLYRKGNSVMVELLRYPESWRK